MATLLGLDKRVSVSHGYLTTALYIFNSISRYLPVFPFLIELYAIY